VLNSSFYALLWLLSHKILSTGKNSAKAKEVISFLLALNEDQVFIAKLIKMKIISQTDTLLHYAVDPNYLEKHDQFSTSNYSSTNWRPAQEPNAYLFNYNTHFIAKESNKENYFINYHHRIEICCIIEEIENDAAELLALKQKSNIEMGKFLEKNTMNFFHLLNFKPMIFSNEVMDNEKISLREFTLQIEIKGIKKAMGILPLEEMTDEEKQISLTNGGYESRNLK